MQPIVVLDTNVLISALLSLRGNPFRCLALAKTGVVQSVTCQEVLDEFAEKLCDKFGYAANRAQAASDEVRKCSSVVTITNALKVIAADPDDATHGVERAGGGRARTWAIAGTISL